MNPARPSWRRRLAPLLLFLAVFAAHALYLRHVAQMPSDGWADADLTADPGQWGFRPYLQAQDYFLGFSYALGAAFTLWSLVFEFSRSRQKAIGNGGGVSWGNLLFTVGLVSFLRWAVCFLLGCCGSPMLAVYASIFGAKAFGIGKPFVALITLLTTGCAYVCLSRRSSASCCAESCCPPRVSPSRSGK